jgi:hypothetical protein
MTVSEAGETSQNMEARGSPSPSEDGVTGTPNETALRALMKRTGCPIKQSNGQRRFGPPPDYTGTTPPRGLVYNMLFPLIYTTQTSVFYFTKCTDHLNTTKS